MIYPGLVSITFRQLKPQEIVDLVKEAGLKGIEWGGDIHVPHGDFVKAEKVKKMTHSVGLDVAAYGSYYRVGVVNEEVGDFEAVLKTAVALEAPTLRVWAGNLGSEQADEAWWHKVINESRDIATRAEKEGITISFEYHGKTLTDTKKASQRLLTEINHPNILSYWQPSVDRSVEVRMEELETIIPYLSNVHVFYWISRERRPLDEGIEEWRKYLTRIVEVPGERYALMEFVKDQEPKQFLQDAQVLKSLLNEIDE